MRRSVRSDGVPSCTFQAGNPCRRSLVVCSDTMRAGISVSSDCRSTLGVCHFQERRRDAWFSAAFAAAEQGNASVIDAWNAPRRIRNR